MKAESTIRKELASLEKLISRKGSPGTSRLAYIVHEAIRWAREDTRGWPAPSSEIQKDLILLLREVGKKP